jgi:hypothetical protein
MSDGRCRRAACGTSTRPGAAPRCRPAVLDRDRTCARSPPTHERHQRGHAGQKHAVGVQGQPGHVQQPWPRTPCPSPARQQSTVRLEPPSFEGPPPRCRRCRCRSARRRRRTSSRSKGRLRQPGYRVPAWLVRRAVRTRRRSETDPLLTRRSRARRHRPAPAPRFGNIPGSRFQKAFFGTNTRWPSSRPCAPWLGPRSAACCGRWGAACAGKAFYAPGRPRPAGRWGRPPGGSVGRRGPP